MASTRTGWAPVQALLLSSTQSHVLSTCYVSDTAAGTDVTLVNKMGETYCPRRVCKIRQVI